MQNAILDKVKAVRISNEDWVELSEIARQQGVTRNRLIVSTLRDLVKATKQASA